MPEIDSTTLRPRLTLDERARQDFASSLRAHVLTRMAGKMRERYDDHVLPAFQREHGRAPVNGVEVHNLMKSERDFRFYSAVRNNAQEMVFASVVPSVERNLDELVDKTRTINADAGQGGSVRLEDDFDLPRNVTEIDVHLAPGSYHAEHVDDDVAAGALYDRATEVFAFKQMGENLDDIGQTMANYIRLKYPDFAPQRILDCGCTIGNNTLPWKEAFPAAEVDAIDVAPAVLRYASARAKLLGYPVNFRQMNATAMDYPDASFDVVYSSMFLHELPLRDIHAFFREAYRVLKPGGLVFNMELPPNSAMGAYESFYLDWDSFYNNEPFYKTFRDQDYRSLCTDAGFNADDFVEATLPRYTFVGEEAFRAALNDPAQFDSQTGRMDPKGTRWYGFGAWKSHE